jgi:hypothetical protein
MDPPKVGQVSDLWILSQFDLGTTMFNGFLKSSYARRCGF